MMGLSLWTISKAVLVFLFFVFVLYSFVEVVKNCIKLKKNGDEDKDAIQKRQSLLLKRLITVILVVSLISFYCFLIDNNFHIDKPIISFYRGGFEPSIPEDHTRTIFYIYRNGDLYKVREGTIMGELIYEHELVKKVSPEEIEKGFELKKKESQREGAKKFDTSLLYQYYIMEQEVKE